MLSSTAGSGFFSSSAKALAQSQSEGIPPAQLEKCLHVCMLGDPGMGHSSFLRTYRTDEDGARISPEIEGMVAVVELDDGPCAARFTDNMGSGSFWDSLRTTALATAHTVLLCFAVDSEESYASIEKRWLPCLQATGSEAPIYVLGLRSDMRQEGAHKAGEVELALSAGLPEDDQHKPHIVPEEKGTELAKRCGAVAYLECSARDPDSVHRVVDEVLNVANEYYMVQWKAQPKHSAAQDVKDSDTWLAHERLNIHEDIRMLDTDTIKQSLSMLGLTFTRQHAYLRSDLPDLSLTSIDGIRPYQHLQFLNVSRNQLRSLEPLGSLRGLLHLNASFNLLLRTQTFTAPDGLETMDMSYNLIGELGDWAVHKYLRELNLRGNFISRLGPGLVKNRELQMLDLSENYIAKVENLDGLGLRTLLLAQNRLTSLDGVEALGRLQSLNVRHNHISSIKPLNAQTMPRLSKLCIADNCVTNIAEAAGLAEFPLLCELRLHPNPVVRLPHYRQQVLKRLPRLRSLDAEAAQCEEKVKADLTYGADVDARRQIFEELLPEETFVDRRLITEEGIVSIELDKFGRQGEVVMGKA
jgi:Ras family protein A